MGDEPPDRGGGDNGPGRWFTTLMLAPMVLLLAAFTVYPFLSVLWFSLTKQDLTQPDASGFTGLDNFSAALSTPGLVRSVVLTVVLVVVVVTLEFGLGVLAAAMLWQPIRGSRAYLSLLILPFAATPVAAYLAWRLILSPDGGQLNTLLDALGLPTPAWTSDPILAAVSIMAVDVWQWTPFVILILVAGLQGLPADVSEAAALDGANLAQRLRHVALPMLKPLIVFIVTFRAIDAVRTFDSIWIITAGGPGSATEILTVRIYREAFINLSIGEASALGLLLLIVLIVLGKWLAAPALQRRLES